MGLKIEGNKIEGYTSYYSDPVESELVEDTSQNDGTFFQEASLYVDNALLNEAKELWVALYKEKEEGGISEVMYENQGFFIEHLEDRETEKVKIEFSNDGSRTRIFTRSLLNTNTYYLKTTINYKDGYGNTLLIGDDTQINGDLTVRSGLEIRNNLTVGGDLIINGNLVLKGNMYDKDGWKYELVPNKPLCTKTGYDENDKFEYNTIVLYKAVYFVFDRELEDNLEVTLNFKLSCRVIVDDVAAILTDCTSLDRISFSRDFSTINSSSNEVVCSDNRFNFNGGVVGNKTAPKIENISSINCQYCQFEGKPALKLYVDPDLAYNQSEKWWIRPAIVGEKEGVNLQLL